MSQMSAVRGGGRRWARKAFDDIGDQSRRDAVVIIDRHRADEIHRAYGEHGAAVLRALENAPMPSRNLLSSCS